MTSLITFYFAFASSIGAWASPGRCPLFLSEEAAQFGIVGQSQGLKAALEGAKKVARSNSPVLILGETGTGKELFAKMIHGMSPRKNGPFVAVNCAAITETLWEAEMFGHTKGSFTGAERSRKGFLEQANNGVLFLDEVGELPLDKQAKLLRAVQEGEIATIGGETTQVNVRIIAATNRNLAKMVEEGRFRKDLYYRLNVFDIRLPPLRERAGDVELLANYFVQRLGELDGNPNLAISDAAMEVLKAYPWKGNVRRLLNAIERALIFAEGKEIRPEDLDLDREVFAEAVNKVTGDPDSGFQAKFQFAGGWDLTMAGVEKAVLLSFLEKAEWNLNDAAKLLKIKVPKLRYLVKKYEIELQN